MSCDFKPGDEVVCVDASGLQGLPIRQGDTYVVKGVGPCPSPDPQYTGTPSVYLVGAPNWSLFGPFDIGYWPHRFRKVQKRNDRLTIEAFMTVPGGFEEPKRAPAKKRERVQ